MSMLNDMFVQVDKLTNLKNEFLITFNTWKDKRQKTKINQQQKIQQLSSVAADKKEIFSKHKTMNSDDEFIDKKQEEAMAKKCSKEKRRLPAAKNKELKKSKKVKQEKQDDKGLCKKIRQLNSSFDKMKEGKNKIKRRN